MSLTAYPTLRLKLTMPQALKLQFLPAVPGFNATQAANKVNRAGDTMTGFLTLSADPTAALQAATKQYVDAHSGGGGGGGAPIGAEYITSTADATLTAERVLTDSASITWDRTTAGQIKANTAAGGGNVSNSGTPALDQVGVWVTATTIKGIGGTANQVLRIGAGTTPAFGAIDLSQAAAVTGQLRAASFPVLTGDVTTAGGALATTIANDAVTYAKMQNVSAASVLLGRGAAAGAGDTQEIVLGTNLSMSGTTLNATGGGASGAPQGRLSLQAANAVMSTTTAGATTLYYLAYVGIFVPIFNGTTFVMTPFNGSLSTALSDTTKNPSAVGASKVNDWFIWNDAGTMRLSHGPDWTNDTTRSAGTALVFPAGSGFLVNQVAITNGPGINLGTYVGTTRSNASSQLDWIYGSAATGGGMATFGVWNAYNRVQVSTIVQDITSSWTISLSCRAANGSPTIRVNYVCGLAEDTFAASYTATTSFVSTGDYAIIGVGYDATTSMVGICPVPYGTSSNGQGAGTGTYSTTSLGFHFVSACEQLNAAATANPVSFGVAGGVGVVWNGLQWQGRM